MNDNDTMVQWIINKLLNQIDWISDIYMKWDEKVTIRTNWDLVYEFDGNTDSSTIHISNVGIKDFLVTNLKRFNITYLDFIAKKRFDFKYSSNDHSFRVNCSISKGKLLLIFRILRTNIMPLEELWIDPNILKGITNQNQWLFLVSGPTWSWKSTTLSSLVDYYNNNYNKHIITLENPIEQEYIDNVSVIHQLELWDDFNSFDEWMENILRQDPDIIVLWEIRNKNTLEIALKLAETGHLVFWTIHWKWAQWVIWKIIRMYQNEKLICGMLSDALIGILYQQKYILESWKVVICAETLYNSDTVKAWLVQWKHWGLKWNMETWYEEYMITMAQYLDNYLQKNNDLSANDHININNKIKWL